MREVLASKIEQLLPQDAYLLCSGSKTPSSQARYHIIRPQHKSVQQDSSSLHSTAGAGNISGSSSTGSRSAVGQAPCVLGASRVRPCCHACVQPDVFVGECFCPYNQIN